MRLSIFILLMISLVSCGPGSMPPQEYVNWINNEEGNLTKKVEQGDYTYQLDYKPAEYMALKDIWGEAFNKDSFNNTLADYKGMQYFVLTINTKEQTQEILKVGLSAENEFYGRLYYYSNEVNNDLVMIDNNDTIPCVLHHFERMYKTTPYIKVLCGFEKKYEESTGLEVILRDRIYSGEDIHFNYTKSDINKIPTIKF